MRDVHDLHGGVRGDSYVHGGVLHDDGVLRGIHVLHGPVHDGGFRDVHADTTYHDQNFHATYQVRHGNHKHQYQIFVLSLFQYQSRQPMDECCQSHLQASFYLHPDPAALPLSYHR